MVFLKGLWERSLLIGINSSFDYVCLAFINAKIIVFMIEKIKIRKATNKDIDSLAKIHILAWQETYKGILKRDGLNNLKVIDKKKVWEKVIKDINTLTLVAILNDDIVGFISGGNARFCKDKFKIEIYSIYLLRKYHSRGIGKTLYSSFCSCFKGEKILLWVLDKNPSKKFYENLGGILLFLFQRRKDIVMGSR